MGFLSCNYLFFLVSFCYYVLILGNSPSLALPLCLYHERSILLQFKHSFLIDCPAAFDPSAYPKVNSWTGEAETDGNCCLWDGVECHDKTGHVIGLDLSNSCLHGTFPSNSSLFGLTHLQKLNLAYNDFNYSQVPSELILFPKLRSLNLSNSAFSGQIPSEISHLSQLTLLDLSWNGGASANSRLKLHNPTFETLVQNLTHLHQLDLSNVDIASTVPIILTNLTSLQIISLKFCNLYGEFPTRLFRLPHLQILGLSGNKDLGGVLPQFQWKAPLQRLDLLSTAFSGEVPASVGKLSSLELLRLSGCRFTGSIPTFLGNLTKLTNLFLGSNNFKGDIPQSITNLTQLHALDLANLKTRSKKFISQLPRLHKLTYLQLSELDISGEIPSFLANLTKLTILDLSGNLLTGPFPHWFSNLTRLTELNLRDNQLQGSIPHWFSQFTNLDILSLSNNFLFGNFDTFWKLKNLLSLGLSGINLTFPSNASINSPHFKLKALSLNSCKLNEFPQFLHNQDELQILSLRGNNIGGTIPQWFVNITKESLRSIVISNNHLTGFEQSSVVLPWTALEVFDLSGNRFQGSLPNPSEVSIMIFQVSNNLLTGNIPKQICKASSLVFLDLSNNYLRGHIPNCIADQLGRSMLVLNLRGNNFYGKIPQTFKSSCKLRMINLSQNQLQNELPKSLANCTMLEVLDVGRNHLTDSFPTWLGSLSQLQILVLGHNKFYGRVGVPESDLDFHCLHVIDLSNNIFTGALPAGYFQNWHAMRVSNEGQSHPSSTMVNFYIELNHLSTMYLTDEIYNYSITITNKGSEIFYSRVLNVLRVIDLSSNKFSGEIPDIIGDLKGLQALNLSNNNLHGRIPSSIENIIDLESLDLSLNELSGVIPQGLPRLTSLEVFNVSHNHLVGSIPQGNQFDTFDNSSFDGNLGLCGSLLSKKCEQGDSTPTSPTVTSDERQENSELIDWIIRLLGCASGCIVGFIIGKYHITDRYHEWFMETFARRRRPRRGQVRPNE